MVINKEISIIRKAIISVEVNKQEEVALEELKSFFLILDFFIRVILQNKFLLVPKKA